MHSVPDDILFDGILACLDHVSAARLMVADKDMIRRVHDPRHHNAWLRLLDHRHRLPPMAERRPGLCFLRLAVPRSCLLCLKRTTRRHVFFGVPVCLACERTDPEWCCVSKNAAVRQWGVAPRHLKRLEYREAKNPVFPSRAPMRLYLLSEIRSLPSRGKS